jgi:DNA-binding response OmpR family regulator
MLFIPLGGLGYYFFRKKKIAPAVESATEYITLGQYHFDPKNQHLKCGQQEYQLTFRESKLLLLFANNPNKVLTRNDILAAVWEDEGVVVGRSPDVFISRLRKLLRHDPAVQLKNVHGVGYRLELP